MSRNGVDIFALMINYLDESWIPQYVIIRLFEVRKTNGTAMVLQLQGLLEKFGLIHYVIAFVKVEGRNLGSMAMTLQFIVDYKPLNILQVYKGICFRHVMFTIC